MVVVHGGRPCQTIETPVLRIVRGIDSFILVEFVANEAFVHAEGSDISRSASRARLAHNYRDDDTPGYRTGRLQRADLRARTNEIARIITRVTKSLRRVRSFRLDPPRSGAPRSYRPLFEFQIKGSLLFFSPTNRAPIDRRTNWRLTRLARIESRDVRTRRAALENFF